LINNKIRIVLEPIFFQYFKSSYGELILASFSGKLCLSDWRYRKTRNTVDRRIEKALSSYFIEQNTLILEQAKQQLNDYFYHKSQVFTVPILMIGTEFQQKVWQGLVQIPFGQTMSYLQLAERVANKNSVRAVANANGANGLSIFVPCHRVIGSNGRLTGYAGGVQSKKKLLNLEKI
jgi:methylated-DNA-[protein]-cysteine S-methyltransferase